MRLAEIDAEDLDGSRINITGLGGGRGGGERVEGANDDERRKEKCRRTRTYVMRITYQPHYALAKYCC
jgi:hypothetical protein